MSANHDDQTELRVAELGANACIDLFAAYGVSLVPGTYPWATSDERLLSGVIGFVGRGIRGTCLLAGNEAVLAATCPEGGRLRDWVGELANQLAGRMKIKLSTRGVDAWLTTPIVLSGVRLEPLPRGKLEPTVFLVAQGPVMVWVEAETERGFALDSARPSATPGGEGEVLLF
jgi:hypothetical protein